MKDGYKMTVGLEIHAELKTASKMFCGCINSPEEKSPNINVCPICMGHPGTLPVINKEAVKQVLLVGTAVGGDLADFTEFDRKSYFYPDIPKGYQISQYKYPLVSGGELSEVKLTRIHLEEDTARSTHDTLDVSLVDFNRAGVPLMELVTEPVIHSAEEATKFAKELQLLLQYLGVSDANMEKGEMRVEVNISVQRSLPTGAVHLLDKISPDSILSQKVLQNDSITSHLEENSKGQTLGTKVEIKNINSFRAVGQAINFEFERQKKLLEKGEKVVQETRGWDENKQITFSQRLKESANDYRYFPEPDLPKLQISKIKEFSKRELKKLLPELPTEKRTRYKKAFGLKPEDIEVYINNKEAGKFFESVASKLTGETSKVASNYITSDLVGLSKSVGVEFSVGKIKTESFVKLMTMIREGKLSSRGAKDILKITFESGGDPEAIAEEKDLIQKSNEEEIRLIAEKIINNNPAAVGEYKSGKESLLQFFVGVGMKETGGSVNPEILKKIILELLAKQ